MTVSGVGGRGKRNPKGVGQGYQQGYCYITLIWKILKAYNYQYEVINPECYFGCDDT